MKLYSFVLAVTLFLLASTCCAAKFEAKPGQVRCLQLLQTHVYLGNVKLWLTPNAVRLDGLGKFCFTLVARAPKWQVTAFRQDDKNCFVQPFDDFYDQGLYSNYVLPQRHDTMFPGTTRMKQKAFGFPVLQARYNTTVLTYLENKGYTDPKVAKFLHSAYRVPTEGQIPVAYVQMLEGKDWMTNLSEQGHERLFLNTKSIRLANVNTAEFEIPKNLHPAKSMTRIMSGDVHKLDGSGIDALINE